MGKRMKKDESEAVEEEIAEEQVRACILFKKNGNVLKLGTTAYVIKNLLKPCPNAETCMVRARVNRNPHWRT